MPPGRAPSTASTAPSIPPPAANPPGAQPVRARDLGAGGGEAWSGVRQLMWIGFGFFVLLNGMVYWVLGRALRPVGAVVETPINVRIEDASVILEDEEEHVAPQ